MSAWASVQLGGGSWLPSQLLERPRFIGDLAGVPLIRLGEVATIRTGGSQARPGLPLVRPSDVDPQSGRLLVSGTSGDESVSVFGEDFTAGDVLVPRRGFGPCILATEELRGIAFTAFMMVSARDEQIDPLWLWAVLSSDVGVELRRQRASGAAIRHLTPASLSDALLPLSSHDVTRQLGVKPPQPLLEQLALPPNRSAWRALSLEGRARWTFDATAADDQSGCPLAAIGSIERGRVSRDQCFGSANDNRLEVLLPSRLRGTGGSSSWASPGSSPVTTDASLVFTATGPFRVAHAPPGLLVGEGLLTVNVTDAAWAPPPVLARALTAYFSTLDGRSRLESEAAGATVQRLTVSGLGRVRVPLPDLLSLATPETRPLGERLGAALRSVLSR